MSRALDFANDISTLESKFSGDTLSNVVIDAGQILGTDIDTLENAGPYIPVNITNPTNTQILAFDNGVLVNQDQIEATSSNVDHDLLTNFVANEHIDWTNATENFSTSGTLGVGSNALVVNSSGYVGIGTSSPIGKLAVSDGTVVGEINPYSAASGCYIGTRTNHSILFQVNAIEKMRIDTSGNVGITNDVAIGVFHASGASTGFATAMTAEPRLHISASQTTASDFLKFYNGNGQIGRIVCTGSTTSYNTSSDYRLKENITEITDGITRVKQLNPSRFNFIADPNLTVDGFIAHEVQPIVPEAVSGEKDAVNEDGSINPQGIDQSKLVPLLTAALQESIALIESQQSQIDALTARIEALESN